MKSLSKGIELKNKATSSIFLCISTLFFPPATLLAGEHVYDCTIENIYDLQDDRSLGKSGFGKYLVGGNFNVDRKTGDIEGDSLTTRMALSTKVINFGSSESSFKSLAEFDGQIQVIEIQEFTKSENKPFIALSMGGAGLVTGLCK